MGRKVVDLGRGTEIFVEQVSEVAHGPLFKWRVRTRFGGVETGSERGSTTAFQAAMRAAREMVGTMPDGKQP